MLRSQAVLAGIVECGTFAWVSANWSAIADRSTVPCDIDAGAQALSMGYVLHIDIAVEG